MVIVTQNQYLLASKIHNIILDECIEFIDCRSPSGKLHSLKNIYYTISIVYIPESNSPNGHGNDTRECIVTIREKINAHKVFLDLIQQIREQMPDQLYLDTALERMIANTDLSSMEDKESSLSLSLLQEGISDRSSKKIRKPRKAKRRDKKVLRRVK